MNVGDERRREVDRRECLAHAERVRKRSRREASVAGKLELPQTLARVRLREAALQLLPPRPKLALSGPSHLPKGLPALGETNQREFHK